MKMLLQVLVGQGLLLLLLLLLKLLREIHLHWISGDGAVVVTGDAMLKMVESIGGGSSA